MNGYRKWIFATLFLNLLLSTARAEDIDLFASGLASGAAAASVPNVVFVLDNTANWNNVSDDWGVDPETGDKIPQGLAELNAIHNILEDIHGEGKNINVAIIAFVTDKDRGDIDGSPEAGEKYGGFVRLHMSSVLDDWADIDATLVEMKAEFEDKETNTSQSAPYGFLANDVYSYLAGLSQSFNGAYTDEAFADEDGYQQPYSVFRSPLTESAICSETYLIWVSNPSGQPKTDDPENSEALTALYAELGESVAYALAGNGVTSGGMDMRKYGVPDAEEIGSSAQCYANADACTAAITESSSLETAIVEACSEYSSCYCDGIASNCAKGAKKYKVKSGGDRFVPIGGDPEPGHNYNLDDWTKFLHEIGVPLEVAGEEGEPDTVVRIPVTTYTLDVYKKTNAAQASHSSLMDSAAEVGGGIRQEVTNTSEMEMALGRVFGDIIDINTSFAAVTLPLSATNRAQAENKVFVGMFRPAAQRKPRWLGNLKQYQLAVFDGRVELADVSLNRAINPQTGFAQSCATSFWTTDTSDEPKNAYGVTGPYFEGLGMEPSPTSECLAEFRGDRSVLSDQPDGPFVEKGGVAQQIRGLTERVILTQTGDGALRDIDPADLGESASESPVFDYLVGTDAGLKGGDLYVQNADDTYVDNPRLADAEVMPFEGRRPTIHGDIVHSRPLTVTYGPNGSGGSVFRVFYGANDGLFRSVNPDDGNEDWAFVAPEHLDGISRLYANTPTVDFYGLDASQSTDIGAQPKRYFFDGSTGVFTRYDAEDKLVEGYIYPTMRRGGRMVYALNVSPDGISSGPPTQPEFMWKAGCDEAGNCTDAELSGIGQTWSTPVTGFVRGYVGDGTADEPNPVLLMGGGWDDCLDTDEATLSVGSCSTGNFIYVLNGKTGELLRKFETEGPVVAELELLDIDYDGYIDFAYAADATGNLYRLTLSKITDGVMDPSVTLDPTEWPMDLVAYSNRQGVRFMNQPISAEVGNAVFIAIGAGDRERPLKQNYPYAENVENRFYVFVDQPFATVSSPVDLDSMLNAADGLPSEPDENGELETLLDTRGWYLDLPDQGEQIVNQAAIGGGYVFFNSFQAQGSTEGFCSDLGTAKAYRVPLFAPEAVEGKEFGEGVPIPPIIVTVKLDNGQDVCAEDCGPGEITDDVVTVIIGLEGFEVVDITPNPPSKVREAFRVENVDRL